MVLMAFGVLALPALAQAEQTPSIHYAFDECEESSASTDNVITEEGDPVLSYFNEPLPSVEGSSGTEGDCGLELNPWITNEWARANDEDRSYYQAAASGPNANSLTLSADIRRGHVYNSSWQWVAGDDVCNETGESSDGSCIGYAIYATGWGEAPRAYVKLGAGEETELLGVVALGAPGGLNSWHNLTMTYAEGTLKLYVDGKTHRIGENEPLRSPSVLSGNSEVGVFTVGGQRINGEPGEPFSGAVDNVRFYKQALTPEEIEAIQP